MREGDGAAGPEAGTAPSPQDLKVLVVDDDPLCLMIVAKMLRRCSYEGTAAPASGCGCTRSREVWLRVPSRGEATTSDAATRSCVALQ